MDGYVWNRDYFLIVGHCLLRVRTKVETIAFTFVRGGNGKMSKGRKDEIFMVSCYTNYEKFFFLFLKIRPFLVFVSPFPPCFLQIKDFSK